MARLADDWVEQRQVCIDVLCAYLRMPYETDIASEKHREGEREVRHTIIRIIRDHLRDPSSPTTWCGRDLGFTNATFDGGDFIDAKFTGGLVSFYGAKFTGGTVSFQGAEFAGSRVSFIDAEFTGGEVSFIDAEFTGGRVFFGSAKFSGGLQYHMGSIRTPGGLDRATRDGAAAKRTTLVMEDQMALLASAYRGNHGARYYRNHPGCVKTLGLSLW